MHILDLGGQAMHGLTKKEVEDNRKKYGTNSISNVKTNSFFKLLLESLGDPIIKILLVALAIKVIFLFKDFDYFETLGILIAIFLASFISTISEYGSEAAFRRYKKNHQKFLLKYAAIIKLWRLILMKL